MTQFWEENYERLWNTRFQKLKQLMQEENLSAFQAIERLRRFENFHRLERSGDEATYTMLKFEEKLLEPGRPMLRRSTLQEQPLYLPTYISAIDYLLDVLDQNEFEAIVELGSGYAQNLFELFYRGGPHSIPYFAGELTKSGQEMAAYLARFAEGMNLTSFYFDHNNPDLSILPSFKKILIFTCHSIEQVETLSQEFFRVVTRAAPQVTGIHFEPFGFQFETSELPLGRVSEAQDRIFQTNKWNTNFVSCLLTAQNEGLLKVRTMEKNVIPGDTFSPTSVAIWENS